MKKRVVSLIMTIAVLLSLNMTAFAAEYPEDPDVAMWAVARSSAYLDGYILALFVLFSISILHKTTNEFRRFSSMI